MKQIERIKMLYWNMGMKSKMINRKYPKTNQDIELILNNQYIDIDRHGIYHMRS